MRGNECVPWLTHAQSRTWFPIPMRGNETFADGDGCKVLVVPDPHEG